MRYQLRRLGLKSNLYDLPLSKATENEWIVGRGSHCEITTKSKYASRKHFSIIQKNQDFFIYDHGSANGTYVNDIKIEPKKECQLSVDSIVSVGVPSSAADQSDCIVFVFERCGAKKDAADVEVLGSGNQKSEAGLINQEKGCTAEKSEQDVGSEKLEKKEEVSGVGSKSKEICKHGSKTVDKLLPRNEARTSDCAIKIERMSISEERMSFPPDTDIPNLIRGEENILKLNSTKSGDLFSISTMQKTISETDNSRSFSNILDKIDKNSPCSDTSSHKINLVNIKREVIEEEPNTSHIKSSYNCHTVKMEVDVPEKESSHPGVKTEKTEFEEASKLYGSYNMCGLEVDLFEVDNSVEEELEKAYAAETQIDPDETKLSQLSYSVTEQPIEITTTDEECIKIKPNISNLNMKVEPQFDDDDDGNDFDDVIYLGNIFKSDNESHFFQPELKKVDDDDYTETDKKWMGKLFKTKEECDSFIMSQRENDDEDRIEGIEGDDDVMVLGDEYDDEIEVIVPHDLDEAKEVGKMIDDKEREVESVVELEKKEEEKQEMEIEGNEVALAKERTEEKDDRSEETAIISKSADDAFDYLIGVITVGQGGKAVPAVESQTEVRPTLPSKPGSAVAKDEENKKKKKISELFGDDIKDDDLNLFQPPQKKFRLDYTIPKKQHVTKEPESELRTVKNGEIPGDLTRKSGSMKRKRRRKKSITSNLPRSELERIKDERKQKLKELSMRNSSKRTTQDSVPKPPPPLKVKITRKNRSEFLCTGINDEKAEKNVVDKKEKSNHATRSEVPKTHLSSSNSRLNNINLNQTVVPTNQVDAKTDEANQASKENIPFNELRPPPRSESPDWTNFRVIIREDMKVTLKSCLKKSGYAFMKTYKPMHSTKSVRFDKAPHIRCYVTENKITRKTSTIQSSLSRDAEEVEHLSIEDVIYDICSWNTLWLEEAKSVQEGELPPPFQGDKLKFVRDTFRRSKDYVDSFIPLLLLELWHVISEKWKSTDCSLGRFPALCKSYENPAQGMKNGVARIKCESLVLESNMICSLLREGDLLIVQLSQTSPTVDPNSGHNKKLVYRIFGYLERYTLLKFDTRNNQSRPGQSNEMCQMTLDILVKRRSEVFINSETNMEIIPVHHITANLMLCQAVCSLYRSPLCKTILNPNGGEMTLSPGLKNEYMVFNGPLDVHQEDLVLKIVSSCINRDRSLLGIQGGPGTGKTHVILAVILQLLYTKQWKGSTRPKIVYCAHSNIVVDDVTLKLKNLRQTFNQSERFKLVRFGRLNSMKATVRDISSQYLALQNEHNNIVARKVRYLDNKINFLAWDLSKMDQNGEAEIEEKSMKLHELVKERQTVQNSKPVITLGQKPSPAAENLILGNADVICTTCSFSGAKKLVTLFEGIKTKAPNEKIICIIDEAMHSKESEAIVPLQLGVTHLILFGDSQQLRSPVVSERAQSLGVNRSLFWRILSIFDKKRFGITPIYTLKTQYRMNQEISFFPNKMFYQNCLKDGPCTTRTCSLKDYVLLTCSLPVGNPEEVNSEINDVALSLLDEALNALSKDNTTCHVAVITCFMNQANNLRSKFSERCWESNQITLEFTTIDQVQGQEFDIVLFLFDANMHCSPLANVALTRARCSLLILTLDPAYKSNKLLCKLKEEAAMRNSCLCVHSNMTRNEIQGIILKQT